MIYVDLSHTATTNAHTGVQVVSRRLLHYLGESYQAQPIVFDPQWGHWRLPDSLESQLAKGLSEESGESTLRDARKWPRRLRGHCWRLAHRAPPSLFGPESGVILPEIFKPALGRRLSYLREINGQPVIGIFHDAICLKLPFLSKHSNVERFPFYLSELGQLDGVAAVSESSRDDLLAYWKWLGWKKHPPVQAIPLGTDLHLRETPSTPSASLFPSPADARLQKAPIVLCVSSIEGRKNHLLLFKTAEKLWSEGQDFRLLLIGRHHPVTGEPALRRLEELKGRFPGRIHYAGQVSRAQLSQAYRESLFTVYPSFMEGFGLPVIESLSFGKACVCSGYGALGESCRDGGCWPLSDLVEEVLTGAVRTLLQDSTRRLQLEAQARSRKLRKWEDFARDLSAWMQELPKYRPV